MRSKTLSVLFSLLLFAACAGFSAQRGKEREDPNVRTVSGAVRDQNDDLVEGAIVQLKSVKTLQVRSFITRPDGTYSFHGLSTNVDYELKAEHNDASSPVKRLSVYDSRKKAIINLKLASKQ